MSPFLSSLPENFSGEIKENELLKYHTGFRMGGPASLMLIPGGIGDLRQSLVWAGKNRIPCRVMGNGSSILAHPDGFKGLVIKVANALNHIRIKGKQIYAGAGASMRALLRKARNHGLTGLEEWWGTPSSVGGWFMRMGRVKNPHLDHLIQEVYIMEPDGSISRWIEPSKLFKNDGTLDGVVVEVVFRLKTGIKEVMERRIQIKESEWDFLTQTDLPLAGPVFLSKEDLTEVFIKAQVSGFKKDGVAFLGVGNGFIANLGNPGFQDLFNLIGEIKDKVSSIQQLDFKDGLSRLLVKEVIRC